MRSKKKHISPLKAMVALVCVIAPLALTVLAFSPSAEAGSLSEEPSRRQRVTVQIDGAATPYYAPLYVAQQKGYFADEGLDVEFYYASAAEITKNVAAGNVTFGFPNADTVVMGRANDVPVKIIHTTYQAGLGSVIFKKGSGIERPQDLKGKTVAITSYGSPNYTQLQVILKQAGLSTSDVNIKIVGTGAIVNALATDQVDAICFSMLRTYDLKAQGVDVSEFRSDDYMPTQGNVVVTSDEFLEQHRDVCERFVRALDRSLAWLIDGHLDEGLQIAVKNYAPGAAANVERIKYVMEQEFVPRLWQSDQTARHGFGWSDLDRYDEYIAMLKEYGLIDHVYPASDVAVNLEEGSDEK